jgi:predicted GIY-YIG superfamily endonuclease
MDYKNGKIYSMRSNKTDKIYIGSTTQPLFKRFFQHKAQCCNKTLKELMDEHQDFYIELMETFPCKSKEELIKRENELIRQHKDTVVNIIGVNDCLTTRVITLKDNTTVTREYNKTDYNRTYYQKHKEDINKQIICDCGGSYNKASKSNHFKTERHRTHQI